MEIEILEQQCGGTEFVPRPHRLHLGAQNAEGCYCFYLTI